MQIDFSRYQIKIADTDAEREGAGRLRYRVFVEEMGATASREQHKARREYDDFDPWFDHLILLDRGSSFSDPRDQVVGVYRLMRDDAAQAGIGFYSADEYDLAPIERAGRSSVELGRSCVAADHRGGPALHLLWNGLAKYVLDRKIEILFGVASFHGNDVSKISQALAWLHHNHLAPADLRVRSLDHSRVDMDMISEDEIDNVVASAQIPPLIKAYIRLGGFVGDGAFLDRHFNTIDVSVIMDTTRMTDRYLKFYQRNQVAGN